MALVGGSVLAALATSPAAAATPGPQPGVTPSAARAGSTIYVAYTGTDHRRIQATDRSTKQTGAASNAAWQASCSSTVGPARDPVRYLPVNRSPVPPIAHARQARATHTTACRYQLLSVFPQFRRHLNRSQPTSSNRRIRPTHSPRGTADGLMNRSLSRQKPVTQSCVTGFDLEKRVAGVGFEPT